MKKILILFVLLSASISYSQWQLTAGTGTAYGNTLYCVGDTLYAGTDFGAYKTTDNGNTWITINNGFTAPRKVKDFYYADGKLWCAAENNGLFYSTNFGNLWIREHSSSIVNPDAVVASGNYVIVSSTYVYYSTNLGSNWINMNQGQYPVFVGSLIINGNNIYAASSNNSHGCFVSFLGGTSWTRINGNLTGDNSEMDEIRYENNKIYAATQGGIWSSSDNGTNWINLNTALTNVNLWALHLRNSNIFVGSGNDVTNHSKIYLSNNDGSSWSDISSGLQTNLSFSEITTNSTHAFVMIFQTGAVYRRPLSELIGIQPISSEVPKQFSISQNYPNPFNPVTNINFDVKSKGLVKLAVFNSIGQEVAIILNQELSPGTYKANWNAANYPSGVYYYKLESGSFTETKKMVLIK